MRGIERRLNQLEQRRSSQKIPQIMIYEQDTENAELFTKGMAGKSGPESDQRFTEADIDADCAAGYKVVVIQFSR